MVGAMLQAVHTRMMLELSVLTVSHLRKYFVSYNSIMLSLLPAASLVFTVTILFIARFIPLHFRSSFEVDF